MAVESSEYYSTLFSEKNLNINNVHLIDRLLPRDAYA